MLYLEPTEKNVVPVHVEGRFVLLYAILAC